MPCYVDITANGLKYQYHKEEGVEECTAQLSVLRRRRCKHYADSPMSITRASCPLTLVIAPEMNTPLPTSAVTSWTLTRPAGPEEGTGESRVISKGE